ncbi:PHO85 cyclin-5 [Talaromyces marneffei ATCC 18224]|uniref:G1/S-specific cyclin Pcl5, putative n=1 Tax=Talaromyces marneffei (strain ATCC 18224 / CBS 334.59 / QM 7333) TaxID=441960 RepID=B6QH87_TALMQ|nr:G1/S-specific cyclin Pcl5, putative [Talaromyces marneffei ATCC 18224]EEA22733.1 G1/S-specific cyclin Pcl5, putative [Talaromyces marneffei ATCC 18224]
MPGSDVLGPSLSDPSQQKRTATTHPYSSSVGSSASSSSSSIFSLDCVSTQSSISSSSTTAVDVIWENDESRESSGRGLPHPENASHCLRNSLRGVPSKVTECSVPPELRKHPRRTACPTGTSNGTSASCPRLPPPLVRQCDRKVNFVDSLVDSASQIVETIWPLSVVAVRSESTLGCKGVLPLRTFIQETLRRSRTSFSTLQVALYYLIKIRPHVPNHDFTMEQPRDSPCARAMQCGRRMFLAALILASKYLQDRNYSARAWSKISGLQTQEINQNEMMFLQAVDWKLHVPESTYHRWTDIVLKYTPTPTSSPSPDDCWKTLIPRLTPDLVTVNIEPSSPPDLFGLDLLADAPSPRRSPSRVNSVASMCSLNEQQSPICPRSNPILESAPRLESSNPTLPALHKLGLLPTPQMTPQSCAASTPAVSVRGTCSRRPSFASAMSQAQNMCMSRLALDTRPTSKPGNFEGLPPLTRRSSLARSTSSASSPESMVSDVSTISSRSSRSSSISSCASATCAPSQPRLAVTATRRCAAMTLKECRKNLTIHSPIDETSLAGVYSSPDSALCGSVPDLSNFSLNTPVDMTAHEAAQGLCELSGAMLRSQSPVGQVNESRPPCRKRGRTSSEDQILQSNVRDLMASTYENEVLADERIAQSFLLPKDGHSLSSLQLPIPVPVPKGGIKRACCSAEVRRHEILPTTPTPMR